MQSFQRKRPSRKPFPAHLPRERVVIAAPDNCPCCGSTKLSKLGEDIIETLEVIPRQWKAIQTVREKFSCRDCKTITQPPAPFHVTPRLCRPQPAGHDPVREVRPASAVEPAERYRREGIDLSLSTLADQVDACDDGPAATLCTDRAAWSGRREAARRRHHRPNPGQGEDDQGAYLDLLRDDRPFSGRVPPAAL